MMCRSAHGYSQDIVSLGWVHCHREGALFLGRSSQNACSLPAVTPGEVLCTPLMAWGTIEYHVFSILPEAGDQADLSGLT